MKSNSGNRMAAWTRSLVVGLSAVATSGGDQCGGLRKRPRRSMTESTTACLHINIQIANFAAGFNNGSQDGNGFLIGFNIQIGNIALGLNNGAQDGNALGGRHQHPAIQHRRRHQ